MITSEFESIVKFARDLVRKDMIAAFGWAPPGENDIVVKCDENRRKLGEHRLEVSWTSSVPGVLAWVFYVERNFVGSMLWNVTETIVAPKYDTISDQISRHLKVLNKPAPISSSAPPAPPVLPVMQLLSKCDEYLKSMVRIEKTECYFCAKECISKSPTGFPMCGRCIARHIFPTIVGEA